MASKGKRIQTGGLAYPVGYKPGLSSSFWRWTLIIVVPTGIALWAAVLSLMF